MTHFYDSAIFTITRSTFSSHSRSSLPTRCGSHSMLVPQTNVMRGYICPACLCIRRNTSVLRKYRGYFQCHIMYAGSYPFACGLYADAFSIRAMNNWSFEVMGLRIEDPVTTCSHGNIRVVVHFRRLVYTRASLIHPQIGRYCAKMKPSRRHM